MLWLCLVARVRVHADSHTTQPQQPKQPKPKKTLQKRACAALSLAAYNCAAADAAAEFVDEVRMWVFEEDYEGRKLTDVINERHENPKYLPGVPLGANVVADPDLESTVRDADVLIFCAPHQFMRSICKTLVGKVRCVWLFLSCGVLQQQRTHVSRSAARARAQQHSPSPTNHKNQQPQKSTKTTGQAGRDGGQPHQGHARAPRRPAAHQRPHHQLPGPRLQVRLSSLCVSVRAGVLFCGEFRRRGSCDSVGAASSSLPPPKQHKKQKKNKKKLQKAC